MGRGALSLAFALSCAPSLLPDLAQGVDRTGALLTALVLVPWILVAGLPRGRVEPDSPGRETAALLGFAAPPVALAAALDARAGLAAGLPVVLAGAAALCLLGLLGRASGRRSLYGPVWFVVVPMAGALAWRPRSGEVGWVGALADASPLGWARGAARVGAGVEWPIGAAVALAALWLLARTTDERSPGERGAERTP